MFEGIVSSGSVTAADGIRSPSSSQRLPVRCDLPVTVMRAASQLPLGTVLGGLFQFIFQGLAVFMPPKIFLVMQMKIIRASAPGQVGRERPCRCVRQRGDAERPLGA